LAHNFLGTFNQSQFERFLAFARSQLPLAAGRIQHLKAEINRVGAIVFRYDNGIPQGYAASPPESYLGKLLAAYEVLGGNPFIDLRVRQKNNPIFRLKGTETAGPQYMSNGEVIGAKGLSDAPTAELMRDAKAWVDDTLHARFESLERKIRRATDYSDELKAEVVKLQTIQLTASTNGSLEFIAAQVNQFLSDQNYRAVTNDGGGDKFGFNVYAPFSSYDVATSTDPSIQRVSESAQRQNTGFVGPGQSSPSGNT
jgi:hypothetical protein